MIDKISFIIGSDETGKGDLFGQLTVCCCYFNDETYEKVKYLKIRDSKTLSEKQIHEIYNVVKDIVPYHISSLSVEKYNKYYKQFKNINDLLINLHSENLKWFINDYFKIKNLNTIPDIIIDKFCNINKFFKLTSINEHYHKKINLIERGEDNIAVACASIIARKYYLNNIEELSEKYKMEFPKGCGDITNNFSIKFIKKYGLEEFENISKNHFLNFIKIKKEYLESVAK